MTAEQREQIIIMLNQGHGYKKIAAVLGISQNTVKSCMKKLKNSPQNETDFCKACGKKIDQIEGRKRIIFCCRECRQKWWNSHLDQVQQKAIYSFTCAHCGKEFTAYGNDHRKYCSRQCYINERFH